MSGATSDVARIRAAASFKPGDRVRVLTEVGGHCYPIGSIVTLTDQKDESGDSWLAAEKDQYQINWFLLPEEIEHELEDPRIAEAERRGAVKALRKFRDTFDAFPQDYDNAIVMAIADEQADKIETGAEL